MQEKIYDLIIVGAGPAGLTAGIYAGRAKLNTLIIEKMAVGGTVNTTYEVKNYPGFVEISGPDLIEKFNKQIDELDNVEIKLDEVVSYELDDKIKKITTLSGTFLSRTVILCNGASAKKLGLENEEKLMGSGVSYCAICDGAFFRKQDVAVVGGGNSAMENAIYLSNIANKVYVLNRSDNLRAERKLIDSALDKDNIQILYNTEVVSLNGNERLESITIKNDNKEKILNVTGLFISIGRDPLTKNLPTSLKLSEDKKIVADENLQTNISGVFTAGDVREGSLGQIITACADGAIASTRANQFLKSYRS